MSRYAFYECVRDGNGVIVSGATVSVYLAGTTTPANIYANLPDVTPVNSVITADDGTYSFFFDTNDYPSTQTFKFIISKEVSIS